VIVYYRHDQESVVLTPELDALAAAVEESRVPAA
jgi:hypothetical protein